MNYVINDVIMWLLVSNGLLFLQNFEPYTVLVGLLVLST